MRIKATQVDLFMFDVGRSSLVCIRLACRKAKARTSNSKLSLLSQLSNIIRAAANTANGFTFLSHPQVVAFAICWAPIQVILVLKSLRLYDTTTVTVSIQIISHVLAYLNSCLNPFLYAFLSENFRKAFRKVMWCGRAHSHYILAAPETKSTRTRHTGNGAASVDIL